MTERGIPGLAGGEHIGITVPDLKEAVAFLVDVIGCDFVFDGGDFTGGGGVEPSLCRGGDVFGEVRGVDAAMGDVGVER